VKSINVEYERKRSWLSDYGRFVGISITANSAMCLLQTICTLYEWNAI
jgi:hypothetical protein